MTSETLTCPYCNASIGVPASATAGQRIICPRCGDAFALRPAEAFTPLPQPPRPAETGITADAPPAAAPILERRSRRSNGLIAAVVLGVMLLMAGGGLAFMLRTQGERRAHDTSRPPRRPGRQPGVPEPDIVPVVRVAPDKLAALGYLPANVNVLAGVHVAELLETPVGGQVLRNPIHFGTSKYRLADLPAWVGLRLEDLDHFIFAAQIDDAVIPPFYLVLRTTQPYDDAAMRQRLNGARAAGAGKKKLYAFRAPHRDVPLYVWFADERTLVVALFPDQLEALPDQPADGLRQLPEEVRTVLQQRREPAALVWVVGHSRNWAKTSAGKFLGGMKKEVQERLTALRTFGVWLVPDRSLDVKAVFECEDAAAAGGLEEYFRTLRRPDPTFKTALDGPWLTLQFQADPDFLSRLTKRE